jgi:O-acetyl-ADP-ribose deacetylase (regulator of RNase III)
MMQIPNSYYTVPKVMYIEGDLIKFAQQGYFDVIVHGCNCFSTMGAGIAPQMAKAFGCDKFPMEQLGPDINKLGNIDAKYSEVILGPKSEYTKPTIVVNAYTQYKYGSNHIDGDVAPFDYEAFTICMRKINLLFKGKTIGMPKIGAGLAGGDWNKIEKIIEKELIDNTVMIVIYKPT